MIGPESSLKHETNSRGSNGAKITALRIAVRLGFCNFHFFYGCENWVTLVFQLKLKERFQLVVHGMLGGKIDQAIAISDG